MPPERRRRVFNLLDELHAGAGDGLPEMEAGKIRVPASLPRVGDVTKDAGEAAQAVLSTLERLGGRIELSDGHGLERGERLRQVPVDGIDHSSTPFSTLCR